MRVALLAGEVRTLERDLPRGLVWGTVAVMAMWALVNLVYLHALPVAAMAATSRIGETAATALFGAGVGDGHDS